MKIPDELKKRNYLKVCLTGGPCSGKTTVLTAIKHQFSGNYQVFEVPEVGTIAYQAGVNLVPSNYTKEEHRIFTYGICKAQIDLENYFEILSTVQKKPVLIFTDRGVADNFAYTEPENKTLIMQEHNWTNEYISDERYDLVVYMVTAASGAVEFYGSANNEARSETPEEAIALDDRNQCEYISHPNLRIIDNTSKGIGEKISRVLNVISAFLEKKPETFHVKNFLLKNGFSIEELQKRVQHHHFRHEITRLTVSEKEKVVRWVVKKFERGFINPTFEVVSQKVKDDETDSMHEVHQSITEKEFLEYLALKDPSFRTLTKQGSAFCWKNGYEHNVISVGGILDKNGVERFMMRILRDTHFLPKMDLPDFATGAEEQKIDQFSFLQAHNF